MSKLPSIGSPRIGRWMTLANLATAATALLVASFLLILFQFLALRRTLIEDIGVQARIISENSTAALLFNDSQASTETLAILDASPAIQAAGIFNLEGKRLASYRRDGAEPVLAPPLSLVEAGHEFRLDHVELARRIDIDGRGIGYVVLRANLGQLYARLASYAGLTLMVALGSLAVAYLLVARMRRLVKSAEAHLHYLAHIDPVTGLPNRHAFNERLSSALAKVNQSGGSIGLLLLDLDNFKIVNDTLGHHSGDLLLKLVAQRLLECMRRGDVICRIGGDEFAVILDVASGSDSTSVAEKILVTLAPPFDVDVHEIYVTASIGISMFPEDAGDLETLTRNADTAMYQAKGKGKNACEKFHPELDQRVQKRLSLETKLRKALERGELALYYQPQIRLSDGKLVGLEALLRWQHPELGMVSPNEFIPVAEDSGLIVPIGRWTLRAACRQVAAWREAGLGAIQVSVNLSARQTKDPLLMHDILAALRENEVSPNQLELEITETVLMENVHANVDLLNRLQTAGIRLSIDDFGTGYSSMAYLKRFPIDQVKIDRTFVHGIPGDRDDEAITSAIIAMAHGLGLSVVAEGVETGLQLEFLRKAGCDIMQGYYFSEPQPPELMADFLKNQVALRESESFSP
ncbi:EAL domain-containing protein [Herbaspirillum sp. ST 5-3]|uniref:putative bifunctional diguanylate cyclase/phosphodiesterase n=1 Tax=Oxalobacteraceae TaxID=75682 RepID=UPI0010A32E91|nr:EAL domain-containing protein [Herbaspirillum sp. ST 5-3]